MKLFQYLAIQRAKLFGIEGEANISPSSDSTSSVIQYDGRFDLIRHATPMQIRDLLLTHETQRNNALCSVLEVLTAIVTFDVNELIPDQEAFIELHQLGGVTVTSPLILGGEATITIKSYNGDLGTGYSVEFGYLDRAYFSSDIFYYDDSTGRVLKNEYVEYINDEGSPHVTWQAFFEQTIEALRNLIATSTININLLTTLKDEKFDINQFISTTSVDSPGFPERAKLYFSQIIQTISSGEVTSTEDIISVYKSNLSIHVENDAVSYDITDPTVETGVGDILVSALTTAATVASTALLLMGNVWGAIAFGLANIGCLFNSFIQESIASVGDALPKLESSARDRILSTPLITGTISKINVDEYLYRMTKEEWNVGSLKIITPVYTIYLYDFEVSNFDETSGSTLVHYSIFPSLQNRLITYNGVLSSRIKIPSFNNLWPTIAIIPAGTHYTEEGINRETNRALALINTAEYDVPEKILADINDDGVSSYEINKFRQTTDIDSVYDTTLGVKPYNLCTEFAPQTGVVSNDGTTERNQYCGPIANIMVDSHYISDSNLISMKDINERYDMVGDFDRISYSRVLSQEVFFRYSMLLLQLYCNYFSTNKWGTYAGYTDFLFPRKAYQRIPAVPFSLTINWPSSNSIPDLSSYSANADWFVIDVCMNTVRTLKQMEIGAINPDLWAESINLILPAIRYMYNELSKEDMFQHSSFIRKIFRYIKSSYINTKSTALPVDLQGQPTVNLSIVASYGVLTTVPWVAPPARDIDALFKAVAVGVVSTIAIAASVLVGQRMWKRFNINRSVRAMSRVKTLEAAALQPNATLSSIKAYTKSVRRYNLQAALLGWSPYVSGAGISTFNDASIVSSINDVKHSVEGVSNSISHITDDISLVRSDVDEVRHLIKSD